jgi:hypothetical protein
MKGVRVIIEIFHVASEINLVYVGNNEMSCPLIYVNTLPFVKYPSCATPGKVVHIVKTKTILTIE